MEIVVQECSGSDPGVVHSRHGRTGRRVHRGARAVRGHRGHPGQRVRPEHPGLPVRRQHEGRDRGGPCSRRRGRRRCCGCRASRRCCGYGRRCARHHRRGPRGTRRCCGWRRRICRRDHRMDAAAPTRSRRLPSPVGYPHQNWIRRIRTRRIRLRTDKAPGSLCYSRILAVAVYDRSARRTRVAPNPHVTRRRAAFLASPG
jgi:hypothetical protein